MLSHFQASRAYHTSWFLRKTNAITPIILLLPSLHVLYCSALCLMSGISFWPFWLSCPGCIPSKFLVQSTFSLAGWHKKIKSFWLCKHCSVTEGTLVYYHHYFYQKSKAQYFMAFYEESWFHLSQNFDSGWCWKKCTYAVSRFIIYLVCKWCFLLEIMPMLGL